MATRIQKECGVPGCRCMQIHRKKKKSKAKVFDHEASLKKFGYCMIPGCKCTKRRVFAYHRNKAKVG